MNMLTPKLCIGIMSDVSDVGSLDAERGYEDGGGLVVELSIKTGYKKF